jgi:hypothetical protein
MPLMKRNRDSSSAPEDQHTLSPTKVPVHVYSLPADYVGGAAGLHIPIKFNKAGSPATQQQQLASMIDVFYSADEELLIRSALSIVWAHITNLGNHPHPPLIFLLL